MKTIYETAKNSGEFNSLVMAVDSSGLMDTLKGKGPFTVFAPSDKAFASLPKGAVEKLLSDKPRLHRVLTHHVLKGKVMSNQANGCARTIEGSEICFSEGGMVENANITKTDIECTNGVIHVIDNVLMPN